jgi:hypothetical protein
MTRLLLAAALAASASVASAAPYFRLLDPAHPQVGASFLISPKSPGATIGVTDVALVTHSPADGTVIPDAWRPYVPPVAWTPLQLGAGGSLRGDAIVAPGTSANLAPAVAALLLRGVGASSSGWAQALQAALTGTGPGQIRLGVAFAGLAVRNGTIQSAKEAFPGRGLGEIVGNSARLDCGAAWRF